MKSVVKTHPKTITQSDRPGDVLWVVPAGALNSIDGAYASVALGEEEQSQDLILTDWQGESVPPGATIDGVLFEPGRKSGLGDILANPYQLVLAGSPIGSNWPEAGTWSDTDTSGSIGAADSLWGATITAEDVNDSSFGVQFSVVSLDGDTAYVDGGALTIYYTESEADIMSVESQIKAGLDRIAMLRQSMGGIAQGGTSFWDLVDDAGDEAYENRIKGSMITTADAALRGMTFWDDSALRPWFTLHQSYFKDDLKLPANYWQSYLTSKGWRAPYEASLALVEALGANARLAPQWVFPKGVRPVDETDPANSGMHKFITITGTAGDPITAVGDGALPNYSIGAPLLVINLHDSPSPNSLALRCATQTSGSPAYKDITASLATDQYAQTILGAEAVVSEASAGQKDVQVASTSNFKSGEWALLVNADYSIQEAAKIASLGTGPTRLTMQTNLINSFSDTAFVLPMFVNVSRQSGSLGDGKSIEIYAWPDRVIQL